MDRLSWMLVSPHRLKFGVTPDGGVVLRMDYDSAATPWLSPDIILALEFTPEEARSLAFNLLAKAEEVDAA